MAENTNTGSNTQKKTSAPKAKVAAPEQPKAAEEPRATVDTNPEEPEVDFGTSAQNAVKDGMASASSWLDHLFPGHGNAALFAIVGFVAALLLFQIGFWRTLIIVLLVVVGIAYGQYLDGNPKIYNSFKKKFGNKK